MVEMGFDIDVAKPALKKTGSDVIKALDIIKHESYGTDS